MGLLLQKTNILRDIKEDVDCGRGFWPRSVFSSEEFCTKLGQQPFKELTDVVNPKNAEQGLWVMNAMIVDALSHATDSLDYLSFLRNQSVFNFCAIPAVMALATLELCYNNPNVLKQNVKIRKGQAVQVRLLCRLSRAPREPTTLPFSPTAHHEGDEPERRRSHVPRLRQEDPRQVDP